MFRDSNTTTGGNHDGGLNILSLAIGVLVAMFKDSIISSVEATHQDLGRKVKGVDRYLSVKRKSTLLEKTARGKARPAEGCLKYYEHIRTPSGDVGHVVV